MTASVEEMTEPERRRYIAQAAALGAEVERYRQEAREDYARAAEAEAGLVAVRAELARANAEVERWKGEVALLRDALGEFHEFVTEHLDPDPHPIEAYLCWRKDRVAELRRALDRPA